jgi:hypothetical protein
MMHWFGESWGSHFNDDSPHAATPVDWPCCHCDEPIIEGDQGVIYANGPVAHLNCFLRQTTGSVAHVLKTCSCYVPGASETDPPELTKRQAADLAVELYEEKLRKQ